MNSNLSTVTDHDDNVLQKTFELASQLANAGDFIPAHFRQNPGALSAAILTGRELGLSPMASLRGLYVINGKVGVSYDVMVGLLRKNGYKIHWEASTNERAKVVLSYKDNTSIPVEYTLQDAQRAGLTGKAVWKAHPASMLRARAISNAARAFAGDVLSGIYGVDEVEEIAEKEKVALTCEAQSGSDAFDQILLEKNTHNNEEDAMSIDVYGGFLAKINSSKSEDELKIAGAEISHCEKLTDEEKNNLRERWKSHKELLNHGGNETYEH